MALLREDALQGTRPRWRLRPGALRPHALPAHPLSLRHLALEQPGRLHAVQQRGDVPGETVETPRVRRWAWIGFGGGGGRGPEGALGRDNVVRVVAGTGTRVMRVARPRRLAVVFGSGERRRGGRGGQRTYRRGRAPQASTWFGDACRLGGVPRWVGCRRPSPLLDYLIAFALRIMLRRKQSAGVCVEVQVGFSVDRKGDCCMLQGLTGFRCVLV